MPRPIPVQRLKSILLGLGKGIFPKSQLKPSNDEIGEMSQAMNSLVTGLKETTDFAHEIGQSNFNYQFDHCILKLDNSGSLYGFQDHNHRIFKDVDKGPNNYRELNSSDVHITDFVFDDSNNIYYITEDNILYSMESEPVGRWNPDSGEIEKILDLEED